MNSWSLLVHGVVHAEDLAKRCAELSARLQQAEQRATSAEEEATAVAPQGTTGRLVVGGCC